MTIHIIRLLGVAYVGVLSFIIAFTASYLLNKVSPPLDKKKSKFRIFLEISLQFGVIGYLLYSSRNLIKNIPFPLEGYYGYAHSKLGELRSLPLIVFIFMFFQERVQDKMKYIIASQKLIPVPNT